MADLQSSTFKVGNDPYPIDRYAKDASARQPVIVVLHGVDGMVGESETEVRRLAEQIAGDGYLVFVPHYFGAAGTGAAMPHKDVLIQRTMMVDSYRPRVAAAVDHALAQPESDATRFGIIGLSLGGGLGLWYAQSAATVKIRALVDFFGHISDPDIYRNAGALPPTLVFHNRKDGIVDVKRSEDLIAALKRKGVVHDSVIFNEPAYPERWDHTFRPGGAADVDSRARTRKWLDEHVRA